jgi:hypothetical protein
VPGDDQGDDVGLDPLLARAAAGLRVAGFDQQAQDVAQRSFLGQALAPRRDDPVDRIAEQRQRARQAPNWPNLGTKSGTPSRSSGSMRPIGSK